MSASGLDIAIAAVNANDCNVFGTPSFLYTFAYSHTLGVLSVVATSIKFYFTSQMRVFKRVTLHSFAVR